MSGWLRTRIGLGLLSIAGATAGHYLSYWFVAPDPHHRGHLLESTGHAGESPFLVLSIAALVATCIAVFGGRAPKRTWSWSRVYARLAFIQVIGFLGLEAVERLVEGTSLIEAASEPVVAMGLAVQLLVAVAGALLLRVLQRVAATVSSTPPRLAGASVLPTIDGTIILSSRYEARAWEARGPPATS
jgi:hypothetical protein